MVMYRLRDVTRVSNSPHPTSHHPTPNPWHHTAADGGAQPLQLLAQLPDDFGIGVLGVREGEGVRTRVLTSFTMAWLTMRLAWSAYLHIVTLGCNQIARWMVRTVASTWTPRSCLSPG